MTLNRTQQPSIRLIEEFQIKSPNLHIMPNGIPAYIFSADSEDVVRLDIMIRGGQWEQSQPLQAIFTNRMLREGSKSYTSAEIAEKLDFYGAWLDVSSSINHSFITLYSLTKYFPQTLAIVASMIKEPLFPEKEFQMVIANNKQQFLINQEKVDVLARKQLNLAMWGMNHPCGHYTSLEDYDSLTPDILRQMYHNFYYSRNCTCYLSGHITDSIIKQLEKEFGQEEWGMVKDATTLQDNMPNPTSQKQCFYERADSVQSSVCMGQFTIDCKHTDFHKLRLLITIFGGYFGSRLMKNIREQKGYTYNIGAWLATYPFRNILSVSTQAANEYIQAIIGEIRNEIDRLQNDLVSKDELSMVKNYVIGDLCRSYENLLSWSDAYIYLHSLDLPDDFFRTFQQTISEVTSNDIREIACKYLHKDEFKTIIVGKKLQ